MTSSSFGCDKCSITFATLDEGLHHLRTVVHHAEAVQLLSNLDIDFRTAAANYLLFSFTRNSRSDHELAVADAISAVRILVVRKPHLIGDNDMHSVAKNKHHIGDDDIRGPAKRHRLEPGVLAVDNSSRTQSLVNAPNVVTNVFMEPIKVRVHLTVGPAAPTKVFSFPFMRTRHTTISRLLAAVTAAYKGLHDVDVDMEAVAGRRLVMHMLKKGVPTIGGLMEDDTDLREIRAVDGAGWYGQLEIG